MTTLEKIRAEIANLTCDCINGMVNQYAVLQIIDKYAEQEPMDHDSVSRGYLLGLANKDGAYGYISAHEIVNAPSLNRQEPSEDAVSRQAVLEQINCWIGSGEYRYTNATDYLNKRIKALQAVNPQEKAGYWMPIEYPTGVEAFGVKEMSAQELQCSECGKTVDISDGDFKYCPYCKARMFEPRESEDKE